MQQLLFRAIPVFLLLGLVTACGKDESPDPDRLDEGSRTRALEIVEPWRGDLDGMYERGVIRVVTTFSRTNFFFDEGQPRGAVYETLIAFEQFLNRQPENAGRPVRMVLLPVPRDQLLPALAAGRADLAASNLTITETRQDLAAFSAPIARNVREVVVTGPAVAALTSLDELAGRRVHVRLSSSYLESLQALNRDFQSRNLEPVRIMAVDELLEAEDILELVAAGSFDITILDDYLATLWDGVLDDIRVYPDLAISEARDIAWAYRPQARELGIQLDRFIAQHRQGTLFGNVVFERYFLDNRWIRDPLSVEASQQFLALQQHFRKYAKRYGFDWLLVTAQAFQESRFDQSLTSAAGAVGIMQIKPSTARDPQIAIPDIHETEKNIHAGLKYLAFLRDRYFSDGNLDDLNETLFSLAAYNAGPARVRRLRSQAAVQGLDPDRWFRNVEHMAPRETRHYVRNIYKYYVAYREYALRNEIIGQVILLDE